MTSPPDEGASGGRSIPAWRARAGRVAGPVALVLLAFLLVGLHVAAYPKLSPIDELQHVDYLFKAPHLVATGERIGQDAMREEACRGIDVPLVLPACSAVATYDPDDFQEDGFSTAAINSPIYYTLTGGLAWLVQQVGVESLVTAARLVGALWLALGLLVAFAAGRRLGVRRVPLVAALTLVACAQPLLLFSATVTPDAVTLLAGASVVWSVLWWEDRPGRRWPLLVLVSVLVLLVKQTNVVVLGAAAGYLLLRWWATRRVAGPELDAGRGRPRDYLAGLAAVLIPTMAAFAGWQLVVKAVATGTPVPMSAGFVVDSFPWGGLLNSVALLIELPLSTGPMPGGGNAAIVAGRVIRIVLIAGLLAAAVFAAPQPDPRLADPPALASRAVSWARATGLVALLAAPGLIVLNYAANGAYFEIPERYGYSLLAATALAVAWSARSRYSATVLGVVAGLVLLVTGLRLGLA